MMTGITSGYIQPKSAQATPSHRSSPLLRFGTEKPEKPNPNKKPEDEQPSLMGSIQRMVFLSAMLTLGMMGFQAVFGPRPNQNEPIPVKAGEMIPDTPNAVLLKPQELTEKIKADKVKEIRILSDMRWQVHLQDGTAQYFLYDPQHEGFGEMRQALLEKGIHPYIKEADANYMGLLLNLMLLGGVGLIGYSVIRALRNGPGGILNGQTFQAREDVTDFDLSKVAGMPEVIDEIRSDVLTLFNNPESKVGARRPKGILLEGPPGTGKTILAKAIAGELKRPFFAINGSNFVQMYVGLGATRVRELFKNAREAAPAVIFIDEIDAVGKARMSSGVGVGGHDEREQTLNAILSELDGFDQYDDILVIAATNRKDVLDPALVRAGRFDRSYTINPPLTPEARRDILKIHTQDKKLADDVELLEVARQMWPGTSGADIANIANEAALIAERKDKDKIYREDFLAAVERYYTGLAKKDTNFKPEDKRRTAVHETLGHAMVSWALGIPFRYISIVPRSLQSGGTALGIVGLNPDGMPQYHQTREFFEKMACMTLAGKAAEEVYYGHPDKVSTGAANDMEKVNNSLKAAIETYALYPELFGLVTIPKSQNAFDGDKVSPELKARAERVRGFLLDQMYDMTKAFIASMPQEMKEKLVDAVEQAETMNDPEAINQLFHSAGVANWEDSWNQATAPVKERYNTYRQTLEKEANPWKVKS